MPSSDIVIVEETVSSIKPLEINQLESQEEKIELSLAQQLEELEIVKNCMADPEKWRRHVAYSHVKDENRPHHLTAGILFGENKLSIAPALFQAIDETQVISALHIGSSLCGHPHITHGGLLATLLDEITAMSALPNLPGKTGFTANLNINYRHPCISNQFVIIHSEVTSVEGRKAFVKATLKNAEGTLIADATALFIAPRVAISEIAEKLNQAKTA